MNGRALFEILRSRLAARPLVLLLDVDGTLSPIAPTPEAATVPLATRDAVGRIAAVAGAHVGLVSGRAAEDARRLVAVDGLWVIGNHGFELITPERTPLNDPALQPFRASVAAAARDASAVVAAHPGTRLEDKGWTLTVHYRTGGDTAGAAIRPALQRIADEHALRLTGGKMVFELRPPVEVDKGTAIVSLLERLSPEGAGAAVYAGDDRTDEDAFAALRGSRADAVTIKVADLTSEAPVSTAAEFVLSGVDEMRAFLERLADEVAAVGRTA